MLIHFVWRGPYSGRTQDQLESAARHTIEKFFHRYDGNIPPINLICIAAERGGNGNTPIKTTGGREEYSNYPNHVPVYVHLGGTQGLRSLLAIDKMHVEEVRKLLDSGPYNKKAHRHREETSEQKETVSGGQNASIEAETTTTEEGDTILSVEQKTVITPVDSCLPEVKLLLEQKRLAPREKLVRANVPEEDIKRLEATLSSIIYREMEAQGYQDVPNSLQVSVEKITQAIMDHMKLPYNEAGNYRGIVGNFYATRIALFALKWDDTLDPEDRYTDWMFDCLLVLDFVGGKDKLAHLTREREVEVRARLEEEAKPKEEPVTAAQVEEVVREGFLPDNDVFELALSTLRGRKVAEGELALAEANETQQEAIVCNLKLQLESAEAQLAQARELKRAAAEKLANFSISPEILEEVRKAKSRLDALAQELGI